MHGQAQNGFFLVLEGIEGVGKSTCLKFIAKHLKQQGIPAVVSREPGGTALGEKIRQILLHHHDEIIFDEAELLLLFAARAQHLREVILPAMEAGQWVICDRFTDASYAYQGGGRGIEVARIAVLEKWLQQDFRPNLTFILDAPVNLALHRTQRREELDRIEREKSHFFRKVRQMYLRRAEQHKKRYRIIDARKPLSQVKLHIEELLAPHIQQYLQTHEKT